MLAQLSPARSAMAGRALAFAARAVLATAPEAVPPVDTTPPASRLLVCTSPCGQVHRCVPVTSRTAARTRVVRQLTRTPVSFSPYVLCWQAAAVVRGRHAFLFSASDDFHAPVATVATPSGSDATAPLVAAWCLVPDRPSDVDVARPLLALARGRSVQVVDTTVRACVHQHCWVRRGRAGVAHA